MFDTKSSFILSKLGIQRFQSQINNSNSEVIFGVLWGDILTLLDKSFNELEENELKLLTKIIKSIIEEEIVCTLFRVALFILSTRLMNHSDC